MVAGTRTRTRTRTRTPSASHKHNARRRQRHGTARHGTAQHSTAQAQAHLTCGVSLHLDAVDITCALSVLAACRPRVMCMCMLCMECELAWQLLWHASCVVLCVRLRVKTCSSQGQKQQHQAHAQSTHSDMPTRVFTSSHVTTYACTEHHTSHVAAHTSRSSTSSVHTWAGAASCTQTCM